MSEVYKYPYGQFAKLGSLLVLLHISCCSITILSEGALSFEKAHVRSTWDHKRFPYKAFGFRSIP